MTLYELAVIGSVSPDQWTALSSTLQGMLTPFELALGNNVTLHNADSVRTRNQRSAFAGVYFGGDAAKDAEVTDLLIRQSVPIIPVISAQQSFADAIPPTLQKNNGLRLNPADSGMKILAGALLECVGLLRRQRRVFVSYRRIESRSAAVQLHDELSSRGFDVFLDTHDIRPGDPFQDVLWHRLCDSDVLLMLDTPTYFSSKWTTQELGRARARDIQVLRVVWPDHTPSPQTNFAETIYLTKDDLISKDGPIHNSKVEAICVQTESLRSRSIAARYMSITGWLRSEMGMIGATIDGIGAHRAISIKLPDGKSIWAYPAVGIPTADLLNDIAEKSTAAGQEGTPVVVYDHVGIRDQWTSHLKWLDENIKVVRAVKAREAAWMLTGLD